MTPEPCLSMDGSNPRSSRTEGKRFKFNSFCHCSSFKKAKPPLGADEPPTTFTRISTPPKRERVSLITFVQPSAVLISAWTNINSVSLLLVGIFRAVVMTFAPPRKSRLTMALPIPWVPPVTRTRLPRNSSAINGMLVVIRLPQKSCDSCYI